MKKLYILLFAILISSTIYSQTDAGVEVFINEIHYDNSSSDVGEGVEVAGPAGTDLSTFTITRYNGSNGTAYGTTPLSGSIPDEGAGYGTIFFAISGLQNGAPDGVALDDGTNVQFLSYEGAFMAADGVATGIMSTDIGVSEGGGTAVGESLQLGGTGIVYANFTWNSAAASSYDLINPGQTFGAAVPAITITAPADLAVLASGTTSVDVAFTALNLGAGDQVDITVTKNAGAPTITMNVLSSPFNIAGTVDGDSYEVTAEIVNGGGVIDFETINFSISFPCDLLIGAITTTCDAITNSVDTYTTTIGFTGGGTSTYTIDTGGVGTVDLTGGNPSVDAAGTILVTGVDEGVDFVINFLGDVANSSCDINRNINGPICFPAVCSNVGDIIITEIMQNPAAVADNMGEYFEVYNTTGAPIDMQGWDIVDLTNSGENFTIASSLIVPSMGYAVFGVNGVTGTNGGVTVDYVYDGTSTFLGNGSDEISIQCSSTVIDEVLWDNGATFPDPSGASMELSTAFLNAASNDVGANWAPAVSALAGGDLGTPGATNDFALSTNDFTANDFKIYPNPTSTGFIDISSNNNAAMKVTVFDVLGKQVINQMVSNKRLDVSNLNTGVYIMRVTQDNASVTKKLVIK
jgi:Secretion system C-terminal sorting domain/Lamin Tail Domain